MIHHTGEKFSQNNTPILFRKSAIVRQEKKKGFKYSTEDVLMNIDFIFLTERQ